MKKAPLSAVDNPPAKTPRLVTAATLVNLALVAIAIIVPQRFDKVDEREATAAAMSFAIPMALTLAISAATAIRAYILARRQDRPLRWTAFLPAGVFVLGLALTLGLVYSQAYWNSSSEATMPTSQ